MSEVQKTPSAQSAEMVQQFVQFIMMQAQNILFVLGRIPTPDGASMPPNLQAAKMLIDQLEMIKIKTDGNRTAQETRILDEAISNVHVAFAEASGGTPASMMPKRGGAEFDVDDIEAAFKEAGSGTHENPLEEEIEEDLPAPAPQENKRPSQASTPPEAAEPVEPEEHKKKFFKSYG